jgi:arylsulfatase A-like enzyme
VYDASCAIQQDIDSWLYSTAPEALPRNNSEASRLERYRSYLAQVECTHEKLREVFAGLQRSGLYQKATILVHGDHGSRISIRTPLPQHWQKISPRDYIDTYSTLFAIKLPGQAGGYDRRILSINQLFSGYIQDGKIPEGTAWAGTPTVVIGTGIPDKANQSERRKRRLKRKRKNWGALEQPLPAFSFGEVDDKGEEIPTGS